MGFAQWFTQQQPWDWRPDEEAEVVWIEQTTQVHTPNGPQPLFLIYFIVKYRPAYKDSSGDAEPPEIIETYPVCQFDEIYIKAAVLTGPSQAKGKNAVEWAWREFGSTHNHFHLLPKQIQDQVRIICEEKAESHFDGMSPEEWEHPED